MVLVRYQCIYEHWTHFWNIKYKLIVIVAVGIVSQTANAIQKAAPLVDAIFSIYTRNWAHMIRKFTCNARKHTHTQIPMYLWKWKIAAISQNPLCVQCLKFSKHSDCVLSLFDLLNKWSRIQISNKNMCWAKRSNRQILYRHRCILLVIRL